MEDEASTSLDGKVLGNLRVVDLKQELEKRGLSKSGSKKDLVKRLKQQLEFEKLCEERKTSGDFDRKLELDAAIEQNEFVQQYLAQQKKRYAERKEAEKRLELEALGKQKDDPDGNSGENQMTADTNQLSDTDETDDGQSSQFDEPSRGEQNEKVENEDKNSSKSFNTDKRPVNSSETEDEEPLCPSPPSEPEENERIAQKSPQANDAVPAEIIQENVSVVVDIGQNEGILKNISPPSSPESEVGESRTSKNSELNSECRDENNISAPAASDSIKEQTDCIMNESVDYSIKKPGSVSLPVASDSNKEQTDCIMNESVDYSVNKPDTVSLPVALDSNKEQTDCIMNESVDYSIKKPDSVSLPVASDSIKEQADCIMNESVDYSIKKPDSVSSPVASDSIKEQADCIMNESVDYSIKKPDSVSSPVASDSVKEQTDCITNESVDHSDIKKPDGVSLPDVSDSVKEQTDCMADESIDHTDIKKPDNVSLPVASDSIKEQTDCIMDESIDYSDIKKTGSVNLPVVSDSVKGHTDCVVSKSVGYSDIKKPDSFKQVLIDSKDSEISPNAAQDITEQLENVETQSNILVTSEKNSMSDSSNEPSGGISSSENLCKQDLLASMEPSECSSVPYSLSDIQLPESPGHHLKCKELNEEKLGKTDSSPELTDDQSLSLSQKIKSNGVDVSDTINSSNEKVVSDSESKDNNSPEKSPEKSCQKSESENNQQIDESSDVESDKNNSQPENKSLSKDDVLSNTEIDSAENAPKDSVNKEKSLKHPQKLVESDDGKSSDSEKYKSSRLDSRHKSHGKLRKRNRHSRSQSSSSSSSHSSDSSPKRRHSKKSVVSIKNKNFVENDESNQMSEKSSDDKPDKLKTEDSLIESSSSLSSKRRLKIKRDNVPLEVNAASLESMESVSSRSLDNVPSSIPPCTSEKPLKQESTDARLSFSELPYAPRKVSLGNRKLNRKSSEDKNNEPKSKRNKWESFAAVQKTSQTISISTDSLKTWFPDFKLMSEPSSSMELEPDEHSLPVADEKNENFMHVDVSNINDNGVGMKQDSTLQMDVEDSESQEPNFEDSSEQGPVSKILFIQNLVRPFTLNQLKDLLKQNGKIVEEYFWIDKIKSKCFVMYETEKEAIKARNTLNNTRWPSSNPKILSVDYSNEEEMEQHKKGNEPQPKPVIEAPVVPEIPEVLETRISHPQDEHKRKDRDRRKEKEKSKPLPPVREWDKDKVMQDSPEREHIPKEEKSRSSEKKEKKESKKRPNEDTPAKLLDDLFQKTKNPPCIYWLPLTEEQAKQKEEAKKMRKLEREKRNQQLKEQEEAERRNKRARSSRRSREKENRKSSTRSRSPVTRRR